MIDEQTTTNALDLISNGNGALQKQTAISMTPTMDQIETTYRIAGSYARSNMVPTHYQGGKDSVGHANCFLALTIANDLGISYALALQHIVPVKGRAAIDGQLAIGLIKKRAPILGPIEYKFEGEDEKRQCTATVIDRETRKPVSFTLTKAQARKAGWYNGQHSYWLKNEDLMFRYRTATYLARTNYPEVLMGLYTQDEMEDMKTSEISVSEVENATDIKQKLGIEEVKQVPSKDVVEVDKSSEVGGKDSD